MAKSKPRRQYLDADGNRLPSVTEIVGQNLGWGKERLIAWANRVGREGLTTHRASKDKLDAGTMCHELIEAFLLGQPYDIQAKPAKMSETAWAMGCTAFMGYLRLHQAEGLVERLEVVALEEPLVDLEWEVGGTPDIVCNLDGELTILDVKTGRSLGAEVLLQLEAYAQMWSACRDDEVTKLGVLHVPASGAPPRLIVWSRHASRRACGGALDELRSLHARREEIDGFAEALFGGAK